MAVRLFPEPTTWCTPFVLKSGSYQRYVNVDGRWNLIRLDSQSKSPSFDSGHLDWHQRMPDRERLTEWLGQQTGLSEDFLGYVDELLVVPTFSMCAAEALTRVFMRQIVTARQARRMFASFVESFGYRKEDVVGFPSPERVQRLGPEAFREIGLGFRAERLVNALGSLQSYEVSSLDGLLEASVPGIGPWSRAILDVELARDYSRYPFEDKSGVAIRSLTGVDVAAAARLDLQLAADLYVYGASFVESKRT
jgi:hypothetical protein